LENQKILPLLKAKLRQHDCRPKSVTATISAMCSPPTGEIIQLKQLCCTQWTPYIPWQTMVDLHL